jgi:hypothetical protein
VLSRILATDAKVREYLTAFFFEYAHLTNWDIIRRLAVRPRRRGSIPDIDTNYFSAPNHQTNGYRGPFLDKSGRGVKLTAHLHLEEVKNVFSHVFMVFLMNNWDNLTLTCYYRRGLESR